MEKIELNLISTDIALTICADLLGRPTENRVVLAVSETAKKTASGLLIPDTAKEDIPKKGVVVSKGITNDDPVHDSIKIGDIVSYGIYGGKEIFPSFESGTSYPDLKFFVLASNEVIYIEPNN